MSLCSMSSAFRLCFLACIMREPAHDFSQNVIFFESEISTSVALSSFTILFLSIILKFFLQRCFFIYNLPDFIQNFHTTYNNFFNLFSLFWCNETTIVNVTWSNEFTLILLLKCELLVELQNSFLHLWCCLGDKVVQL